MAEILEMSIDCHCTSCTTLFEAWYSIQSVINTYPNGTSDSEIHDAVSAVKNAFMALHRRHCRGSYGRDGLPSSPVRRALRPPYDKLAQLKDENMINETYVTRIVTQDADEAPQSLHKALHELHQTQADAVTAHMREYEEIVVKPALARLDLLSKRTPASTPRNEEAVKTSSVTRRQVLVCDHCRSHGLRCNEASVCDQCIMLEVACVHRLCMPSPNSRAQCPRPICYYLHTDHMPDIQGTHHPEDPNWIVLPGKLKEYLSDGPLLERQEVNTESPEYRRKLASTPKLQHDAKRRIKRCVEQDRLEPEAIDIHCRCQTASESVRLNLCASAATTPHVSSRPPPVPGKAQLHGRHASGESQRLSPLQLPPLRLEDKPNTTLVGKLEGLGLDDCTPPPPPPPPFKMDRT